MLLLIGDIQGCDDALQRLLSKAGFSPSRHQLVALGDMVNRWPSSLAVLRRLRGLEGAAQCVLGNHELHLLAVAHGARAPHRSDTFADVLRSPDGQACMDWLRRQPLALLAGGWLCVHAGVHPAWDRDQALARATEVSAVLSGPDFHTFITRLYGNHPSVWDEKLAGLDRWLFIVNAFTRMRFCLADGRLDFDTKEGTHAAPPGARAWFDMPARACAHIPIAFGHWSTLGAIDRPDLLALDTGCVWGGPLSAAWVDGERRDWVQVPCPAHALTG